MLNAYCSPCIAKKHEKERPQLRNADGLPDVDAVLTVRDLGDMIKRAGIVFNRLPDEYLHRAAPVFPALFYILRHTPR